ncbi:MAG: ABC transporter ATP-binding protein [Candidatus Omnitrophota bacterium]
MQTKILGLTKTMDRHPVLKGIDMEFQTGAVNVIIGPNGAGKTTLLRLIGLLEKPDNGHIRFDNRSVHDLTRTEKTAVRRKIGFVFQHPLILEGTVWHNMTYGLHVRKKAIDEGALETMLERVGLRGKIRQEAKKLSGGEKQRLQLARVMLLEPELFLLDEPTANLDPLSTRTIETLVMEIARSGKTVALSTHNLAQARMLGHTFFFLQDGQLVQQGSADEIFQRPVSLEIAEFASTENILYGDITTEGEQVFLQSNGLRIRVVTPLRNERVAGVIRAEDILISREPIDSSARNSFRGSVLRLTEMGMFLSVAVECQRQTFISFITKESARLMELQPGREVMVTFKSTAVHLLKI